MYTESEIRKLAFWLWKERGRPTGSPDVDWFRAIEILWQGTTSFE